MFERRSNSGSGCVRRLLWAQVQSWRPHGKRDPHAGLLFDPVAVHVTGLVNTPREVLFFGRWQLGYQKLEKDR